MTVGKVVPKIDRETAMQAGWESLDLAQTAAQLELLPARQRGHELDSLNVEQEPIAHSRKSSGLSRKQRAAIRTQLAG